jgi:hypothetical protein
MGSSFWNERLMPDNCLLLIVVSSLMRIPLGLRVRPEGRAALSGRQKSASLHAAAGDPAVAAQDNSRDFLQHRVAG